MTPQVAAAAPVTMLALKKKEKSDKNVVTMLAYRKPASSAGSTSSASSAFEHHLSVAHQNHLINMHHLMNNGNGGGLHRPSSPNSSGYDSDSLVEQENCDVFTSLLNSASYAYNNGLMMMAPEHIHHDMLHSHPVWSPQVAGNGAPNGTNNVSSPYFHRENENKFLVQ
ncbi:hypothetical protein CRE_07090 [Caenorhabditis remanei]|uniref:Uncharacterized protein n=1 Tax=Caenorhabditis remanei TaxID=31234 RepID=E3NL36_CAERE|nr:hypothetical protein CRE_07090 [Caenorhabditis remanei]